MNCLVVVEIFVRTPLSSGFSEIKQASEGERQNSSPQRD
jgi:hypothetical protein